MRDISEYSPGRFAYLMDTPFARPLWDYLSADDRIADMLAATAEGWPAISRFLADLETRFAEPLGSPDYPAEDVAVFANNMIKQIMERQGYELVACGLCRGRFVKSSGVYGKREQGPVQAET